MFFDAFLCIGSTFAIGFQSSHPARYLTFETGLFPIARFFGPLPDGLGQFDTLGVKLSDQTFLDLGSKHPKLLFFHIDPLGHLLHLLHLGIVTAAHVIFPFNHMAFVIGNSWIFHHGRGTNVVGDDRGRIKTFEIKRYNIVVHAGFGLKDVGANISFIGCRFVTVTLDHNVIPRAKSINLRKNFDLLTLDDEMKQGNIANLGHFAHANPRLNFDGNIPHQSRINHAIFSNGRHCIACLARIRSIAFFDNSFPVTLENSLVIKRIFGCSQEVSRHG